MITYTTMLSVMAMLVAMFVSFLNIFFMQRDQSEQRLRDEIRDLQDSISKLVGDREFLK